MNGVLRFFKVGKKLLWVLVVCVLTLLVLRIYDVTRKPDLKPWHTYVPEELSVTEVDAASWKEYLVAEEQIFKSIGEHVTQRLDEEERVPSNRYYAESPVYPGSFSHDWNRSYVLQPDRKPVGIVVLLHGLTDSPYSLRHIARRYQELGYVAVGVRIPGHGTVPAGLTDVAWENWMAATRLAVREGVRLGGEDVPLHVIGFSNGGALAMKYTLDTLSDTSLARPDKVILISPMIGVTSFARFAGLAGLPAMLPAFSKAAWLSILPEFNPFKYNSFPVNGARQSHRLSTALQERIVQYEREGRLQELPPILTFQSLVDSTVSTQAVLSRLYDYLPNNGSELVIFDLNRAAYLGPLIRPRSISALERLFLPAERAYRMTMVTNVSEGSREVLARVTEPGSDRVQETYLDMTYPSDLFSLSHVALPFPLSDSLYGREPTKDEFFGIHLGTIVLRGERNVLVVGQDDLSRIASNPFYPYLLQRIEEQIRN